MAETRNQLWSQATAGVQSDPEAGDKFGIALGAGEFGNGLSWDLAIAVAHEDVVGLGDEGAVNVLYGYVHHGLTTTGDQFWNQDSTGILDDPEAGDLFGAGVSRSARQSGPRSPSTDASSICGRRMFESDIRRALAFGPVIHAGCGREHAVSRRHD